MTTDARRVVDDSAVVALARRVRAWLASTWLVRTGASLTDALETANASSAIAGTARTLARFVRHAFVCRWLTKEPDPDVVVIDLRETYAVGPFVALADRLAPRVRRTWRGSLARRIAGRVRTAAVWTWVGESRTVRLLAAALEPPKPPEEP